MYKRQEGRTRLQGITNDENTSGFYLEDQVYAEKDGNRIYPKNLKVELQAGNGQFVAVSGEEALKTEVQDPENGKITYSNYLVTGQDDTIAAGAPLFSTYRVTAVFSKDDFISHFYDEITEYKFTNDARLVSRIMTTGESKKVESKSSATGWYGADTEAYPITLAQYVTMGNGMDFIYDAENLSGVLSPFEGTGSYLLKK